MTIDTNAIRARHVEASECEHIMKSMVARTMNNDIAALLAEVERLAKAAEDTYEQGYEANGSLLRAEADAGRFLHERQDALLEIDRLETELERVSTERDMWKVDQRAVVGSNFTMLARAEQAEAERDALKAEVERLRPTSLPVSVREACRRRMPLDGVDAQALGHALTLTERERDASRALLDALHETIVEHLSAEDEDDHAAVKRAACELAEARRMYVMILESRAKAEDDGDAFAKERDAAVARAEVAEQERDAARESLRTDRADSHEVIAGLRREKAEANRLRDEALRTFRDREDAIEKAEKRATVAERYAKVGEAVLDVLDSFSWDHAAVRAEVESDRLAETVEGCVFAAIERAIRPADVVPRPRDDDDDDDDAAHAQGGGR